MKTNGAFLAQSLRRLPLAFFLFIYSHSDAQSKYAAGNTVFVQVVSHPALITPLAKAAQHDLYNNKNPLYDKVRGKETNFGISDKNAPAISPWSIFSQGNYLVHLNRTSFVYPCNPSREVGLTYFETAKLRFYAAILKKYALDHHYDTAYAFLANMGILSNRKRFFVVNLTTMEIEQSGLVSHGRGAGMSIYDRRYSNDPDSRCTSLGKYKVTGVYRGSYGLSYRISGLDSSNSNAQKRRIVLHSMHGVPDMESFMPACVSEGCPAVSERFFSSIRKVIDTRKKPMLLWIIDSNLELPEITEIPEKETSPLQPALKREMAKTKADSPKKQVSSNRRLSARKTENQGLIAGNSNMQSTVISSSRVTDVLGFHKRRARTACGRSTEREVSKTAKQGL